MSLIAFKSTIVSRFLTERIFLKLCCLREFITTTTNKIFQKSVLLFILAPTLILLHLMRLSSLGAIVLWEKCPCHALFSSSYYGWLRLIFVILTQLAAPIFALGWLGYYYFEAAFPLYVSVIGALMCIGFFYGGVFALGGFIYFLMGKVFWDRDVVLLRLYYVFMAAYWALLLLSFSFRIYCDLVHFDVFGKLVGLMPVAYCEPAELSAIHKSVVVLVDSAVAWQQGSEKDALGFEVHNNVVALAKQLVSTQWGAEKLPPKHLEQAVNVLGGQLMELVQDVYDLVFFSKPGWVKCPRGQFQEYQVDLFHTTLHATYQNFIFYNPHDFPEISDSVSADPRFSSKLDSFIFEDVFNAITPKFIKVNPKYVGKIFLELYVLVLSQRTTEGFEDAGSVEFIQYVKTGTGTVSSFIGDEKDSSELFATIMVNGIPINYIPDNAIANEEKIFAPQIEVISELDEATKKRIHISLDKLSATMDNTGYLTRFWNWCFSANLSDQEYINNLYSTTDVKTQERMLAGLDLPPENPKRQGTFLFPEKWCFVGEELRPNGTDLSVKFAFDEGKFGISVNDSHDARWQKFLTASGRK